MHAFCFFKRMLFYVLYFHSDSEQEALTQSRTDPSFCHIYESQMDIKTCQTKEYNTICAITGEK